jgi:drug/metabolite transporter (DMT)-like permease
MSVFGASGGLHRGGERAGSKEESAARHIEPVAANRSSTALLWALTSDVSFTAMNVFVRLSGRDLHPAEILFVRDLFCVPIILGLLLLPRSSSLEREPAKYLFCNRRYVHRVLLSGSGMVAFYFGLSTLPLADVTCLFATKSLFVVIFARIMLGERTSKLGWGAAFVAFAGALIVVQGESAGLAWRSLIIVLAAVISAIATIQFGSLCRTERPLVVVLNLSWLEALVLLPVTLPIWTWPSGENALYVGLVAVLLLPASVGYGRAFASISIASMAAFESLRLPLAAFAGFAVFGEPTTTGTWIGGGLICLSIGLAQVPLPLGMQATAPARRTGISPTASAFNDRGAQS